MQEHLTFFATGVASGTATPSSSTTSARKRSNVATMAGMLGRAQGSSHQQLWRWSEMGGGGGSRKARTQYFRAHGGHRTIAFGDKRQKWGSSPHWDGVNARLAHSTRDRGVAASTAEPPGISYFKVHLPLFLPQAISSRELYTIFSKGGELLW